MGMGALPENDKAKLVVREMTDILALDLVEKRIVTDSRTLNIAYDVLNLTHWRKIRTNNGLERIMKEIRRRTRVVGSFPAGFLP